MEKISNCPVCQHPTHQPFLTCQDYTVSQESFELVQCQQCQFVWTNPRPTAQNIGRYYRASSYISHSDTREGLVSRLYHAIRDFTLKGKLSLLNTLKPERGSLLDVGCGTGLFLYVCQKDGWQVSGIEPDENARRMAVDRTGLDINAEILGSYPEQQFDAITMWHVLEHIHYLNDTLDWLYQHLTKSGHLIIAVPNLQSRDAQVFGKHWAAYDVPRHLYHFAPKTLEKLLLAHGFELQKIRPMYFDSFYVSMLSTQYQRGAVQYLRAFWQGLRSNLWASSHQQNYSSLIYVFKKK
jgi:2-polyprenyl-3-methyl-5-hydroxy-6-metoxy-1,4-benzoquinol methylase